MSSPSLSPAPETQKPSSPGPIAAPPARPRVNKWLIAIPVVLVLVLVAAGVAWKLRPAVPAQSAVATRTTRVVRAVLARTVRLTGTVSAKNFASVSAPVLQGPEQNRE